MTTTDRTYCKDCQRRELCDSFRRCLQPTTLAGFLPTLTPPLVPVPPETKTPTADAIQIGGDHYKIFEDYQPWQVFEKWYPVDEFLAYLMMSAINYLPRERYKGGVQDVKKAIHTLQKWVEVREANPLKNQ